MPSDSVNPRDRLLALLAAQRNPGQREAILEYVETNNGNGALLDGLIEQGLLPIGERAAVEGRFRELLHAHGDDATLALRALTPEMPTEAPHPPSGIQSDATLATVSQPAVDAFKTRLPSDIGNGADSQETLNKAEQSGPGLTQIPAGDVTMRFQVLRPHAEGGLGRVLLARDAELPREVALKEIKPKHAKSASNRARFVLEAQVTGGLEHPGIVPVYGLGHYEDGRPYYAMRFIRGQSLKEAIAEFHAPHGPGAKPHTRALALRELLERFLMVCNAIDYAHSRGVLHRDLKPANVMLGSFGETLVVDWGLAKTVGQRDMAAPNHEQSTLETALVPTTDSGTETRLGTVIGTPAYMSPEQARGDLDQLGPASDIYSLGGTLYHLLAGRPPYDGRDINSVLQQVRIGALKPPRLWRKEIPPALEAVCLKAMAQQPEERYATARDLANEIRRWMADEPVTAYREPWTVRAGRWARRHRVAVAVASALVLSATFGLLLTTLLVSRQQSLTEIARQEAVENAFAAEEARVKAEEERHRAQELAEEGRQRLVRVYVGAGLRLVEQNKPAEALVWLTEALALDEGRPELERKHRIRLAGVLQQCTRPAQIYFHDGAVLWGAFSPDGHHVVTCSEDHTARVWNTRTGEPSTPPLRYNDSVTTGLFSPDGHYVAAGGADNTARIWDVHTGRPVTPPLDHPAAVRCLAFSPDGQRLASGCVDGVTRIWESRTGRLLVNCEQHSETVLALAWSTDGKTLATASADDSARLWHAATGNPLGVPIRHVNDVLDVAFSDDGKKLVITCGTEARIWEVATGKALTNPMRHAYSVSYATFTPDGAHVLTYGGNTYKLWNAVDGKALTAPASRWHKLAAWASPDARHVLNWYSSGMAWNRDDALVTERPLLLTGNTSRKPMHHAHFSPDGSTILTDGDDGAALLWDAHGKCLFTFPAGGRVRNAVFSPDGTRLATASSDKTARVWNAATGQLIGHAMEHEGTVWDVAFSPDGKRLLTASADRTARIWDATTGKPVTPPLRHGRFVQSIAWSPDGTRVVSGDRDGVAQIWDASSGQPVGQPMKHTSGWVYTIRFHPTGTLLLTAGSDRTARLWDPATGQPVREPMRHPGQVHHAAFNSDGSRIATACGDGLARIWDTVTGQVVVPTMSHQSKPVRWVAFSSDDRRIVTTSEDLTARVWDALTGEALSPPLRHPSGVFHATFSPDGTRVLSAGNDGSARLWRQQIEERPVGELRQFASLLSGLRSDPVLGVAPCETKLLREAWATLHTKYPQQFTATTEQGITWHETQLKNAETAGLWTNAVGHLDALLRHDPTRDDLRKRRAQTHLRLKSWTKALPDIQALLKDRPDSDELLFDHARVLGWINRLDDARNGFARLLARDKNEVAYLLGRCLVNWRRKDLAAADADYAAAASLSQVIAPSVERYWFDRHPKRSAQSLAVLRALDDDCTVDLRIATSDMRLLRLRGLIRAALGQWADAAGDFTRATQLVPTDLDSWRGRARCQMEVRDLSQALADCSKVLDLDPANGAFWFLRGQVNMDRQDFERAVADLDKALSLNAAGCGPWFCLAYCANELKQTDRALDAYTQALERVPLGVVYNNRGNIFKARKQYAEALADYDAGIALAPRDALLRTNRGEVYRLLHQHDKAFADLNEAARLDPKSTLALNRLGDTYLFKGDYNDAIASYGAAIKISPQSYSHYRRGQAYARLRDSYQAFANLDEAIRRSPRWALPYSERALLHGERGDWSKAEADYAKAAEVAPGDPAGWLGLAQLKLRAGDKEGYNKACADLLSRFQTSEEDRLGWVAWQCALVPGSVADIKALVALAEKGTAKEAESSDALNALALALYRAGRFEEALAKLGEQSTRYQGRLNPRTWVLLALVNQRLGRTDEARCWLDRVSEALAAAGENKPRPDGTAWVWTARADVQRLLEEAKATNAGR